MGTYRLDKRRAQKRYALLCCLALAALTVLFGVGQAAAEPPLWEVTSKTAKVYLFGTLHVGRSEFYPLPERVEQALAHSRRLVLEAKLDSGAQHAMRDAGTYPAGDSLEAHLPQALREPLAGVLERDQLSPAAAYRMRPWLLGLSLTVRELAKQEYSPQLAVDAYLSDLALRLGKPIDALETQAEQLAVFQSMSEEEHFAILEGSLAQIRLGRTAALFDAIVAAWRAGDATRLERAFIASYADVPAAESINAKLIEARNLRFAEQIREFLRGSDTHFVAVGAAHLVGRQGLVAMMGRAGLRVRKR